MFLTEMTMSCVTRPLSLRRSRTRRSTLAKSDVSFTMLLTCIVRSLTTRTTSILQPRTSPSFINTGGRSSCFSNGSSNTSRSSLSGERPTMRYVFRSMLPSSPTVSSVLLSTTSSLDAQSCRSCESWAVPCSPKMTSWSFSPRLRTRTNPMMGSLKLNLYTINIY